MKGSNFFKKSLEACPCPIVITKCDQKDRCIVYVNRAFVRLTGYDLPEIKGQDCRFLQGTDIQSTELAELRTALREFRSCKALIRNYRKDGSFFLNEVSICPIVDDRGTATHFIGIQRAVDIPEIMLLRPKARELYGSLTKRERLIFELVTTGHSNKAIGVKLGLSTRTVENNRLRIQKKLGTGNLGLLVRYGIALGFTFESATLQRSS